MGESSYGELSKELSNLSFTSNASSATSSSTFESRKDSHNGKHDIEAVSSSDENVDGGDNVTGKDVSGGSTEVSIHGKHTDSSSEVADVLRENSPVLSRDNHNNIVNGYSQESRSSSEKQMSSRVNSIASENKYLIGKKSLTSEGKQISGENISYSENELISRESSTASENQSLSGESTSASSNQLSLGTTEMSEQDESPQEINVATRENTMSTNSEMYQDDFETSRESTMLTNNEMYENDFNDSSDSREQSVNYYLEPDELEKENSVLIERDGKFELVNPSELEAEEMEMLGIPPIVEQRTASRKVSQRPKSNTNKNPEYAHVTSAYALTQTQKEMKKRRISVRHMRMNEEKQRLVEEEEKQRIANKRSYRVS